MKEFVFNGDWKFDFSLPILAGLNSNKFFPPHYPHVLKLLEGIIPVSFNSKLDNNPDPSEEQFNILKWIQNNQELILASLFNHVKKVLYPFYLSEIDFDENWFPPLNEISDLSNVLGIENIVIDTHSKNGFSYVYYSFKFSVDDEHGIVIILHNNILIGFDQIGSIDDQKIIEDLGLDYSDYQTKQFEEYDKREIKIHTPHPKYGKLKPWQVQANIIYLRKLVRKNENEKLIKEIEESNFDINYRFYPLNNNLADIACYFKNMELLKYLIDNNIDLNMAIWEAFSTFEGNTSSNEMVEFLAKKGANLDSLNQHSQTTYLSNLIISLVHSLLNQRYHSTNEERKKEYVKEEKEILQKIQLLINLGANPFCCNKNNESYVDILKKHWNTEKLEEIKIKEIIEKLINNKR